MGSGFSRKLRPCPLSQESGRAIFGVNRRYCFYAFLWSPRTESRSGIKEMRASACIKRLCVTIWEMLTNNMTMKRLSSCIIRQPKRVMLKPNTTWVSVIRVPLYLFENKLFLLLLLTSNPLQKEMG